MRRAYSRHSHIAGLRSSTPRSGLSFSQRSRALSLAAHLAKRAAGERSGAILRAAQIVAQAIAQLPQQQLELHLLGAVQRIETPFKRDAVGLRHQRPVLDPPAGEDHPLGAPVFRVANTLDIALLFEIVNDAGDGALGTQRLVSRRPSCVSRLVRTAYCEIVKSKVSSTRRSPSLRRT
jgi:hypothetical protein